MAETEENHRKQTAEQFQIPTSPSPLHPRDRIARIVDERGIDLAQRVPAGVRKDLAQAAGITGYMVANYLTELRKQRGFAIAQAPWSKNAKPGRSDPALLEAAAAVRDAVLDIGLRAVCEELREPLRKLVEIL